MKEVATHIVGTISNLAIVSIVIIQTCPVAPTCSNRISLLGAEC